MAVIDDVIDGGSLLRVDYQHLIYDVEELPRVTRATQGLVVRTYYFPEEVVEGHLLGLILEGADQSTQLVGDAAQAPHVTFEIVAASLENFWRHVEWGANSRKCLHGLTREVPAETEITQLKFIVRVDEDIRRFQVSVHYTHLEHVLEGPSYLEDVGPDLDFGDELARFSNVFDVVLQITFFRPLNCYKHLVVLNEAFQVFGYVAVLQLFHEFYLLYTIVSLFDVIDIENLQKLERNELLGLDVLGLEHEGELPLANWLQYFVVSVDPTIEIAIPYRTLARALLLNR